MTQRSKKTRIGFSISLQVLKALLPIPGTPVDLTENKGRSVNHQRLIPFGISVKNI
jgi:hypothetical protein